MSLSTFVLISSGVFFLMGVCLLLRSHFAILSAQQQYEQWYAESSQQCGTNALKDLEAKSSQSTKIPQQVQTKTVADFIDTLSFDLKEVLSADICTVACSVSGSTSDTATGDGMTCSVDTSTKSSKSNGTQKLAFTYVHNMSTDVTHHLNSGNISTVVDKVVTARKPAILRNLVSDWKAMQWDWWSISKKLLFADDVLTINRSTTSMKRAQSTVVYTTKLEADDDDDGFIHHEVNYAGHNHYTKERIMLAEFLSQIQNHSEISRFYVSNYRYFEAVAQVQNDTTWRDFIYSEPIAVTNNVSVDGVAPLLWMLYPNSAVQARYSEYHTMRLQLQGHAKYTIIPPEYSQQLYLYPSTHVSAFQSQVQFHNDQTIQSEFPGFNGKVLAEEVQLCPGDVLYVPPYHFVHVETTGAAAVALDVLSPSLEQLILLEAYSQPVPFKNTTEKIEERVLAGQIFLMHVLSRVPEVKTPRSFARTLYRARFASLFSEDSLFIQASPFNCYKDMESLGPTVIAKIDKDKMIRIASFVAEAVNDPAISKPVKILWLQNYVETIASWAMGSAAESVLFIRECLKFDYKLEVVEEVEGPSVFKIDA